MNAGHELDALVAEKVMGWKKVQSEDDPAGWCWLAPHGSTRASTTKSIPFYSTDIAAAWEVLEKQGVSGMAIIHDDGVGADGKPWACVWNGMQPVERIEAEPFCTTYFIDPDTPWAETVPLAICLAALKAVGLEVMP